MAQQMGAQCHLLLTNGDFQLSENYRTCSGQSRWHNSFQFSEHPAWVAVARDKKHFRTNTQLSGDNSKCRFGNTKFGAGNTKFILAIPHLVLAMLDLVLAV